MSQLAEQQRILGQLYDGWQDHVGWCEQSLNIRDRQGRGVALRPLAAHVRMADAIRRQRQRGRPVRIVYLKSRRIGVSVAACATIFQRTAFVSGQHSFIVSYVKRSALEIYDYIEQFFHGYRPYGGLIAMPPGACKGQRADWTNGSYIEVGTAKNVQTGRSFDLRHVLLDEFAFYDNASLLMTALLQSVPDDPDTTVIIPSTANGVGGAFYDLWYRATDPARESEWIAIFFGWWEEPGNVRPLEIPAAEFGKSLSRAHPVYGDELAEKEKYSLSLEQLSWRRWTIANKCDWNLDKFRQEYPGSPEEAFVASGRPRLSHVSLNRMPVMREALVGELLIETVGVRKRVAFLPNVENRGAVTIYRRPEPHAEYVIGADPSEGHDVKSGAPGNQDPDYSVACVLDARTGEQVAKLRDRIQPAAFGEALYALGSFYNWAYLVPEAKGAGLGTIEKLLDMSYPLEKLHKRRADADVGGSTLLQYYGFETTNTNRPQLISALDDALREQSVILRDANTVQECRTFIIKANGKAEHASECHDDEVLALALAVIGIRTAPRPKTVTEAGPRAVSRYGRRRYTEEDD